MLVAWILNSAYMGENRRYCYSLGVVDVVVQKLWHFCNISVITEDIYLKLGSNCSLSKEQSILSRETIQNSFFYWFFFFFQKYAPFPIFTFYPLSRTPQPSVGTHMQCFYLSFLQCFFVVSKKICPIWATLKLLSANAFSLDNAKIFHQILNSHLQILWV